MGGGGGGGGGGAATTLGSSSPKYFAVAAAPSPRTRAMVRANNVVAFIDASSAVVKVRPDCESKRPHSEGPIHRFQGDFPVFRSLLFGHTSRAGADGRIVT